MKLIFNKLMSFLKKAWSEDNGNPSSLRINIAYSVIILLPCIAFILVYTVIAYKELVTYVLDAVLLFISSLMGIKVWQKGQEK